MAGLDCVVGNGGVDVPSLWIGVLDTEEPIESLVEIVIFKIAFVRGSDVERPFLGI